MKDTDKVTLTVSQLKKLVRESKTQLKEGFRDDFIAMDTYDSIMKRAGLFDHISQFKPKLLEVWFDNLVVYWKTKNPSPGDLIAIDTGKTIYFNILDEYHGETEKEVLNAAVNALKRLMGPSDLFDMIDNKQKKLGIINW